jgi:membrane fusion protein, multidrug efflux system
MNRSFRQILVCLTALVALSGPAPAQQNHTDRPPPVVFVQTVSNAVTEPPTEDIGRVEALEAVDIRARVSGFIENVAFKAGAFIKQGDTLFVVEPGRYQAAVAAAKAQLARAEASREQALKSRDRNAQLVRRNAVARVTFDDAQAALDIAEADVAAAHASLTKAGLDLSYTQITAPISGRIGQALFTTGNLVGPDAGPIARLVQVDPVRVVYSIAEGKVVTLRQQETTEAQSGDLKLTLTLPNGAAYEPEGKLEFIGPEVDPRTGTVAVRAIFPNQDGLLMPGQFVKVAAGNRQSAAGPAVPQSAILQDREGRFVYVLSDNNTVQQRRIETGAKIGDLWAVSQGLKAGQKVVVQGMQRLADGIPVQPVEQAGGALP